MSRELRHVRLAIIDNSIEPRVYRPVEHWGRSLPVPYEAFVAREGQFPDLRRFTHLLLTGSEASILEPDAWVKEEEGLVREAARRGLAVLGSCWGHQLLAQALAGPGHVGRASRPEIGWVPIRLLKTSGLLGRKGDEPWTFSVHFDEVRDLPAGFEILACSEGCAVQAMRLRGRPVWGLQCHPEVDIPTARKFLRDLVEMEFKGREFLLKALAEEPRDSGLVRRIVLAFLAPPRPGPGKGNFGLDKKRRNR
ncbi:MAG TPA: type 1 glutamine amidotransferase [Burkholderiales bacterium]|nr:type 1 glutamine amidotransferase [Burkholderiales bacterium]